MSDEAPRPRVKSYKREVAGACLIFVGVMVACLFSMADVAKITALQGMVTGLGSTVVIMALAAFGLHGLTGGRS